MKPVNHREIDNLIFKVLENCSSDKDIEKLKYWFDTDPNSITYYCDFVKNYTAVMSKLTDEAALVKDFNASNNAAPIVWEHLVELETHLPALELEFPNDIQELDKKTSKKDMRNNIITLSIIFSSVAAVLVIAFNIFLSNIRTYEVASITDTIDVQWSSNTKLDSGSRLCCSYPLQLTKGVVKIMTDKDVEVIIEAPAEFKFTSLTEIELKYGKLYSKVSKQGHGFSVSTPNSTVVDLGTEFGVISQIDGNTDVFMFSGKASLYAGSKEVSSKSKMLTAGFAGKVDRQMNIIDIPMQKDAVVRHIDSKSHKIWRGANINLADIIGGGNGFNTGTLENGINSTNGEIQDKVLNNGILLCSEGYHPVKSLKYVDGVFNPGFTAEAVSIASDKSITAVFDENTKCYWGYIINGAYHYGPEVPKHNLILDGITYGTIQNPAISMHSNQGVTFDLQAMRNDLPGIELDRFQSLAGLSDTVKKYTTPIASNVPDDLENKNVFARAEFYVYLDGKELFKKTLYDSNKPAMLDFEIPEGSRFLTLAVTELNGSMAFDWALFGKPEITLKLAK